MRWLRPFVALGALGLIAMFVTLLSLSSTSKAAYPAGAWHVTQTMTVPWASGGQPATATTNLFTVPTGMDLTIQTITYDFDVSLGLGGPPFYSDNAGPLDRVACRIEDDQFNPNPTNYGMASVSDSASITLSTDRITFPREDEFWTPLFPDLQYPAGANDLVVRTGWLNSQSHRIEPGLVIPAGNKVRAVVSTATSAAGGGNVTVRMSGILQ